MRQLLRNYRLFTRTSHQQHFRFAPARTLNTAVPAEQTAINEQQLEIQSEEVPSQLNLEQNPNQQNQVQKEDTDNIDWYELYEDNEEQGQALYEEEWQIVGDHLIREDFNILSSPNRKSIVAEQIKKYEAALNLNIMDHLNPKIYDEGHFKRRLAEFHLNTASPLIPTLLKQRINFINQDSLFKMIKDNKISVIKQLIEGGAFESTNFIAPLQVNLILKAVKQDPRNEYLLNLLCYENSLLLGIGSMKEKLFYKSYQADIEQILFKLNNSKSLNKLRMLWSFEKLYLYEHNLAADIVHELTKIKFTVNDKKQSAVNKESSFIVTSAFSQIPFQNFVMKLLKEVKTYEQFIKSYSLSIMLLSKLLAIHKMLPERLSNELHPIFELFQFNIQKSVSALVLRKLILELLSHEDHSRITYENYKRCYGYWLKDYTQPAETQYHSPLSELVKKKEQFSIVYEKNSQVEGTAKTIYSIALTKTKKPQEVVKQGEVIRHLLAGRYDEVFDNFIVSLGMATDPNSQHVFTQKLKRTDRELSFASKQVEALYKLKLANNHFFYKSLPKPLDSQYLQIEKPHEVTELLLCNETPIDSNQDIYSRQEAYRMKLFFEMEDYTEQSADQEMNLDKPVDSYPYETVINFNSFVFGSRTAKFYEYLYDEHPELMEMIDPNINDLENQDQIIGKEYEEDEEYEDDEEAEFIQSEENERKPLFNRHNNASFNKSDQPRPKFFTQKSTAEFSTYNQIERRTPFTKISAKFSTELVQEGDSEPIIKNNIFDFDHIEEYRVKPIQKDFLKLIQSEQHIPNIGSGTTIAKYLFLHSKENGKFVLNPNKAMNIEFTSAIGTRTKDYGKYLKNSLFNYELSDDFYEELLLDQLASYNRYEFKLILAHLIHFKESLTDPIIDAICNICEKELTGYTFMEFAQFIKVNSIRISDVGLERLTKTWHKFDIINEDMLPFIREYCRKMKMNMRTQYYGSFCKSLIKTEKFDKLELVCLAILVEIKPKPFRYDASMKAENLANLEKEWKIKEQEQYVKLYFELIEVVVTNLGSKVPAYLQDMFDDFKKLRTNLNEKQLGYAFVCYCLKRQKIEELLAKLDNEPEKGTSFMYDCLLQALLSNFNPLEDLSEKMLDITVIKNRITLETNQIMKSLIVFKRSSSSNSFSKFLQHCIRFQPDIHKNHEVKKEMYFIMNNNVEDVSVGGVFNLLDFIFSEKREKERIEYRAIKLSEEEKFKKLQEIQQTKTKAQVSSSKEVKKEKNKKKLTEDEQIRAQNEASKSEERADQKKEQNKLSSKQEGNLSKDAKKKLKKEKTEEKERKNSLVEQIVSEEIGRTIIQANKGSHDEQLIMMIKNQTKRHQSAKRKSVQSLSQVFGGEIETMRQEEEARIRESEKKNEKKDTQEDKKGGKKGKGKAK